jgi:hypothetical protein
VHRQILAQLLITTDDVDQNANLGAAVNIRNQLAFSFKTGEATDTATTNQCRTVDSTVPHPRRGKRSHVAGFFRNQWQSIGRAINSSF